MRMCYCDSGRKYPIEITLHSCLTFKAPVGIDPMGVLTWRKTMRIQKEILCPTCGAYLFTDTKATKMCWTIRCKACGTKSTYDPEYREAIRTYKHERETASGARFY